MANTISQKTAPAAVREPAIPQESAEGAARRCAALVKGLGHLMGTPTRKRARKLAAAGAKVSVSKAALMARINRKLAEQGQKVEASRSARAKADLGDFYLRGEVGIDEHHVDPAALARELGVLKHYERAEGFE